MPRFGLGIGADISNVPVRVGGSSFVNEYSLVFDGVDEFGTASFGSAYDFERTDPFSLSAWFDLGAGGNYVIMSNRAAAPSPYKGYALQVTDVGKIRFALQSTAGFGDRLIVDAGSISSLLGWYSVIVTYDGSSTPGGCSIYINNVSQAIITVTNTLSTSIKSGSPMLIGKQPDLATAWNFNGNLDELAVWNKELSSDEASEIYNSGAPASLTSHSASANLAGWWRMGDGGTWDGSNWTIPDASTNSNDMTTTNMEEADRSTDVPT